MWDGGRLEDVEPISNEITDSESWKTQLIKLGDKAIKENRTENVIAYYRMSEFFMYDGDEDKLKYYQLASMLYFAENGFDVYLFEGPGQGGVVREQGKHFTPYWEKPVKTVLDALELEDVTIIGASLGGMLAPRAAAFDKRIKRVIGWSIFPNFLSVGLYSFKKSTRGIVKWILNHNFKWIINSKVKKLMKKDPTVDWGIKHGMYAYEVESPFEYLKKLNSYQMVDVGHRITQDMLVIGAEKDHFINKELYKEELDSLVNVHSLTYRLFTEKEYGEGHCNVGNSKLCFDTMINWIEQIKRRDLDDK